MAVNDVAFTPKPFFGAEKDSEKVEQWITYLETYFAFRAIQGVSKVQLFHLLMADSAADWLRSLDESTKSDYHRLLKAFRLRYSLSDIDRWKKASSLWEKMQGETESVDAYITSVQNAARIVPITDNNLIRFAIIRGLRPQIRLHVLQSSASDLESVIRAARVAEAALAASTPPDDVKDLTAQVARLIAKFDSSTSTVAAVEPSQPRDDLASSRRVRFAGRERRDRPASPSDRNSSPFSDRRLDDGERYRQRAERSPSPLARWRDEDRSPQQHYTRSSSTQGRRSEDRRQHNCGNCGRSHGFRNVCFAQNLSCFKCSKRGHVARLCRSMPAAPSYPNWQQSPQFAPPPSSHYFYPQQFWQPTQPSAQYCPPPAPSAQQHS